jgi:hypothetical protein
MTDRLACDAIQTAQTKIPGGNTLYVCHYISAPFDPSPHREFQSYDPMIVQIRMSPDHHWRFLIPLKSSNLRLSKKSPSSQPSLAHELVPPTETDGDAADTGHRTL